MLKVSDIKYKSIAPNRKRENLKFEVDRSSSVMSNDRYNQAVVRIGRIEVNEVSTLTNEYQISPTAPRLKLSTFNI